MAEHDIAAKVAKYVEDRPVDAGPQIRAETMLRIHGKILALAGQHDPRLVAEVCRAFADYMDTVEETIRRHAHD